MSFAMHLSDHWIRCQYELFPLLEDNLGALPGRYQKLYLALEAIDVEGFFPRPSVHRLGGRPQQRRAPIVRAFLAKMYFNIQTTSALRERLLADQKLRSLCGWSSSSEVSSKATFSRAFKEFAQMQFPARLHAKLIEAGYKEKLVGHISRDSTAIRAREKPVTKPKKPKGPKRKRGRPRKGEERAKEPRRLELQGTMSKAEMLEDLPKACTVGCEKNAKGRKRSWIGYKLHLDAADGQIPISCIVTSASLHDSQVAIPLATITAERVDNMYDLMDSAYDAAEIYAHSSALEHKPIIDKNPRSKKAAYQLAQKADKNAGFVPAERERYRERSTVERVFGRLEDEFGGRNLYVRGHMKVTCHLMFGVLALTLDQLMRMLL